MSDDERVRGLLSSSRYLKSVWPGRSWHCRTATARRGSSISIDWKTPLLPRKAKHSLPPRILTWRSCSVVNPCDLCFRSVLFVADADVGSREQFDDGGKDTRTATRRPHQVAAGALADRGQHFRKCEHAVVLGRVALGAPAGVIAILLAAGGVTTGGLQMRARVGGNPHIGPRRRQHQRANARERLCVADPAAARIDDTRIPYLGAAA